MGSYLDLDRDRDLDFPRSGRGLSRTESLVGRSDIYISETYFSVFTGRNKSISSGIQLGKCKPKICVRMYQVYMPFSLRMITGR